MLTRWQTVKRDQSGKSTTVFCLHYYRNRLPDKCLLISLVFRCGLTLDRVTGLCLWFTHVRAVLSNVIIRGREKWNKMRNKFVLAFWLRLYGICSWSQLKIWCSESRKSKTLLNSSRKLVPLHYSNFILQQRTGNYRHSQVWYLTGSMGGCVEAFVLRR